MYGPPHTDYSETLLAESYRCRTDANLDKSGRAHKRKHTLGQEVNFKCLLCTPSRP